MDPVRQFVARKQQLRIPLHVTLTTRADAMGALVAQKPLIPNDLATGVLYAIDTSSSNTMASHRVFGPDGRESTISAFGKTAKEDLENFFAGELTGRLPKPEGKVPASMLNAWFQAEMFDYSKLASLSDKAGSTAATDLKDVAKADLERRLQKLGDPAAADIIAWSSLQRLAGQMEKSKPTAEAGKELKAKVKATRPSRPRSRRGSCSTASTVRSAPSARSNSRRPRPATRCSAPSSRPPGPDSTPCA